MSAVRLPVEWHNRIVCGDALKVMRKLPAGCVDLVVTSPPYNLRTTSGGGLHHGGIWANAALIYGYDGYSDNLPHEQYVAWQRDCLTEMLRLIPEDGAIFYNHKWRIQRGLLQQHHELLRGFPVRQVIIWKRRGGINFNRGYFVPTYEVVYLIAKPKFQLLRGASGLGDVWEIAQEQRNPHPAPFPPQLPERIIGATDAQVVLDPFMGSGTTALAARKLGRIYVGIEQSARYCRMARQRLMTASGAAA